MCKLFFRYAQYSHFKIYSEGEYYKLEIDGYEGNAGDSLNDPWYGSNNSPFSTYNRYRSSLFLFLVFLAKSRKQQIRKYETRLRFNYFDWIFRFTETMIDRR